MGNSPESKPATLTVPIDLYYEGARSEKLEVINITSTTPIRPGTPRKLHFETNCSIGGDAYKRYRVVVD